MTVTAYIPAEIASVSRVRMTFQACGRKLVVEASVAAPPRRGVASSATGMGMPQQPLAAAAVPRRIRGGLTAGAAIPEVGRRIRGRKPKMLHRRQTLGL